MMRCIAFGVGLLFAATLLAEEPELPTGSAEPLDIEPPILIQESPNRNIVYTTPANAEQKPADPERLVLALEKAKKNAASGERLYKSGIIAKVDAENRVLKAIRLEAELAQARLELAKQNVEVQQVRFDASEITAEELEAAKSIEAAATSEAESATAKKNQAELAAAELNLRRQQKLLAMGSGRKSEVNRAQEKLSTLQQKN